MVKVRKTLSNSILIITESSKAIKNIKEGEREARRAVTHLSKASAADSCYSSRGPNFYWEFWSAGASVVSFCLRGETPAKPTPSLSLPGRRSGFRVL